MADRDMGRKSQDEPRDWMDRDNDRVRGRADEMEDASNETEEFEDTDDLDDEAGEEEEGEENF